MRLINFLVYRGLVKGEIKGIIGATTLEHEISIRLGSIRSQGHQEVRPF
jgi:hypothetical protein